MSWLDIHQRRLANEGGSIKEAYALQTANFINTTLGDSPTSLIIEIEKEQYEIRLVSEKKFSTASGYEVKKLLFKPYTKINNGKIAIIEGEKWLIVFADNKKLAPKAHIRFCNNYLDFKNGARHPCVADSKVRDAQRINEEEYIDLPSDALKVTVSYNKDTKKIKENDRFVINGLAYEVQGFDRITHVYNEEGIMELALKKVPMRDDEKEKSIPEEPVIPEDDYFIEIQGSKEIEVKTTSVFTAKVYLNGSLISVPIEWSVTKGTISEDGRLTAPTTVGIITVTGRYAYLVNGGETKVIEATKEVEIFDNNDWGWG